MNEDIREFLNRAEIQCIDSRGWFIVDKETMNYLYQTGDILFGVNNGLGKTLDPSYRDSKAFYPSKRSARLMLEFQTELYVRNSFKEISQFLRDK